MKYKAIKEGRFISRPNRFIAKVSIGGEVHTVHVKNTGRCRELLTEGACVYLEKSDNENRKTAYDLIAVRKVSEAGARLINMDSQVVNDACAEWLPQSGLFSEGAKIKREHSASHSRFDFYIEDKGKKNYLEVKGVTLERDGAALFPDAPTERGVKHINELCSLAGEGHGAYILFVVQMKGITSFSPNRDMHPEFADALNRAKESNVHILCYDCRVTPDSIEIDSPVPVILN